MTTVKTAKLHATEDGGKFGENAAEIHPKKSVTDGVTTVKTAKLHATEDGGKFEKQRNAQRHNRRTYAAKIEELETK